jgi:hypothetical protein
MMRFSRRSTGTWVRTCTQYACMIGAARLMHACLVALRVSHCAPNQVPRCRVTSMSAPTAPPGGRSDPYHQPACMHSCVQNWPVAVVASTHACIRRSCGRGGRTVPAHTLCGGHCGEIGAAGLRCSR